MTSHIFMEGEESKNKEKLMTHTRHKKEVMGWEGWG